MVGHQYVDGGTGSGGVDQRAGAEDIVLVGQLVNSVITSYQVSSRSLWDCAKFTWQLFEEHGLYERHFTDTLVHELAINRDTLYHWRKAWELRMRTELFPNLSISHYYHCADYLDRMEDEALKDFLQTASEESWSVRKLSAELEEANNDTGTYPWIMGKIRLLFARLEKIYGASDYSGLDDTKRAKLRQAMDLIKDVIK